MSEFEGELDYGGDVGEVDYGEVDGGTTATWDDVQAFLDEQAADLPVPGRALPTVTSRLFHEDGTVRETPHPDSSDATWLAWGESQPEGLPEPPPVDWSQYTPEEIDGEVAAMGQAAGMLEAEQVERDKISWVRERSRSQGFNVRDDAALARVAAITQQAHQRAYVELLSQGYTTAQASAATYEMDSRPLVDELLQHEAYLQTTRHTRMGRDRERWAQQDEFNRRLGSQPAPSVFELPSMQRYARTLRAQADRQAEQNAALRRIRGW